METLEHLFKKNKDWAKATLDKDPLFFQRLSNQQKPEILWIGCSDSRVPANEIINLAPGEVFVHRNIANVVVHSDLNCLSVIQYAVEVLKIKHIIVSGHYGCGGVAAALEDKDHGLIDNWLGHIKDVARLNHNELSGLKGKEKLHRLCELNVIEQVNNVSGTSIVKSAWENGAELYIHGWIYNVENGILHDVMQSPKSKKYSTIDLTTIV